MALRRANSDIVGSIEEALDRGQSIEEVEETILRLQLPADEKDALSLYAWAWRETGPHKTLKPVESQRALQEIAP